MSNFELKGRCRPWRTPGATRSRLQRRVVAKELLPLKALPTTAALISIYGYVVARGKGEEKEGGAIERLTPFAYPQDYIRPQLHVFEPISVVSLSKQVVLVQTQVSRADISVNFPQAVEGECGSGNMGNL